MIAVVGLVIIGPERLPKVARTLGHIFGRMQRYVSDVKSDISKEMQLEELKALQKSMQETAEEIQDGVSQQVNFIESEVQDVDKNVQKAVKGSLEDSNISSNAALKTTSPEVVEMASPEAVEMASPEAVEMARDKDKQQVVDEQKTEKAVGAAKSEEAYQQPKGIDLMAGLGLGYKVKDAIQEESESPKQDKTANVKKNSEVG